MYAYVNGKLYRNKSLIYLLMSGGNLASSKASLFTKIDLNTNG